MKLLAAFCALVGMTIMLHAEENPAPAKKATGKASSSLAADIETAIASRRRDIVKWTEAIPPRKSVKYGGYDVLAATAGQNCGTPERATYMVEMASHGLGSAGDEMFGLPALVRYLYAFPQCLTDEQRQTIKQALTSTRHDLFGHGTLNHMVLQSTSWYLLAQYFPDAQWQDANGERLASSDVMAQLKDLLTRRHWRSFQSGMTEELSPTYASADLYPLLNLVDFARDKDVAYQASDEASLEILILKADSFHGELMPPLTRHNVDQSNAPLPKDWPTHAAVGQQPLWYYFGVPAMGSFDLFKPVTEPNFLIMLALSSWRPPAAAWSLPQGNYAIAVATPEFTKWDNPTFPIAYGDTWIGTDYALATGNFVFDPRRYNDHNQSFALAFKSEARRNLVECQHPYWRSNAGEDGWTTDFWSPFLQTTRLDETHAVLLASIPQKDPWSRDTLSGIEDRFWTERDQHKDNLIKLVQCRIPKAVDQLVLEDNWAFFRKGNVFMALGSLGGNFDNPPPVLPPPLGRDFTIVKIHAPKVGLFIAVDDKGGSFQAFQDRVKKQAPHYDPDGPGIVYGETKVRFTPPVPDPAHAGYWRALPQVTRGGTPVPVSDIPIKTPFMTLASGTLTITGSQPLTIKGPPQPKSPRAAQFQ